MNEDESRETVADEIKICPLCGGRVFWFPISNYWGCEKCKNTFNRYTVFPDEVKKTSAVGNAAAMRDIVTALANVILPPRGKADEDGWLAWVRAMQGKARAALAAPQRNCDLYDTQPTMSMAYEAYRKAAMRSYGNGLTGAVPTVKQKPMTYDEWLLAPAAERKGDYDGR